LLKAENIPYGMHTFGRVPDKPLRDTTIDAIVSVDRSLLPKNAKVLAADMEQRIVASGPRELESLMEPATNRFAIRTHTRPARTSTASIPTRCQRRPRMRWASNWPTRCWPST
jgi:cobalamin biosynthesis Mg chelatase CobN